MPDDPEWRRRAAAFALAGRRPEESRGLDRWIGEMSAFLRSQDAGLRAKERWLAWGTLLSANRDLRRETQLREEIRNRITSVVRSLAMDGHAILIGQGSAGATHDLPNGISVRLEAPLDWRVKEVAFREGVTETEARLRVRAKERERAYLERVYAMRYPRKPAFHLVYDCSVFTLAQIAQHVVYAMRLRRLV